jgi:citrate lyase beta subunit
VRSGSGKGRENLNAVMVLNVGQPEDLYAAGTLLNQIEFATGLEGRIRIEAQVESADSSTSTPRSARASVRRSCERRPHGRGAIQIQFTREGNQYE